MSPQCVFTAAYTANATKHTNIAPATRTTGNAELVPVLVIVPVRFPETPYDGSALERLFPKLSVTCEEFPDRETISTIPTIIKNKQNIENIIPPAESASSFRIIHLFYALSSDNSFSFLHVTFRLPVKFHTNAISIASRFAHL